MWRIHLSPSYVYYYCPTLFTKTGSIFYSTRFSHLQTLATQRLLNWCGQREWKCLHIVCLCWYVYFYVVKSGDFHCKQMSTHYKYIKTIYLSFLLLLPQNYILKFSFMLCYQNCKVSDVSLSEFTELLFLFSGFHLIFPPLLLHFFFLVFLQYFPFLFPCSSIVYILLLCFFLLKIDWAFSAVLAPPVSVAHLEGFFPPTLFVFYLQFVFIFLFILFPLLLCSLFLILFLNKFILLSFYLFFLLLHNLLDFLLNLRRVVVTIKGQSKKNKTALHWHILTCRNFSPKLLYKYIKYHI